MTENSGCFKPGQSGNPNGRPKGVRNKRVLEIEEGFIRLLEHSTPKIIKWLDQVAEQDPSKALTHIEKFGEYCLPKLQRTELAADKSTTIKLEIPKEAENI